MTTGAHPMPPLRESARNAPVYVHPGRALVSKDAPAFTTVVGSGLALCLWDPVHGVGGMAHFLLPEAGGAPPAQRYGDVAMKFLVDELAKAGANPLSLKARVYGGCAPPIGSQSGHIGDRNVAAALAFLRKQSIPIVERDIGGTGARKIVFDPRDGAAEVVKILPPA